MNAALFATPSAGQWPGTDTKPSLAGPALRLAVVLALHVALVVWLLHLRQQAPELRLPERVSVRLIEAPAPALPDVAPMPPPEPIVEAAPRPLPVAIETPAPKPRPVRRTSEPPRPVALPLQGVAPSVPAPHAVPVVTEARFDADYLNNPPPVYPVLSRRRGEQGRVLLRVQVSAQGTAERVEIESGSGHARLDAAALEAVRRWRFVPARRGDTAVAASVRVPIVFRLDAE